MREAIVDPIRRGEMLFNARIVKERCDAAVNALAKREHGARIPHIWFLTFQRVKSMRLKDVRNELHAYASTRVDEGPPTPIRIALEQMNRTSL